MGSSIVVLLPFVIGTTAFLVDIDHKNVIKALFGQIYAIHVSILVYFIGLSASAAEAYGFTLVRPSVRRFVRHTPYLENRGSDFDDFLHKATS